MRALVVVIAAAAALVLAGAALAAPVKLKGDPRVIGCTSTLEGKEACATTVALRVFAARITATQKPVGKVIPACQAPSPLRYVCGAHDAGGHTWKGAVAFKRAQGAWWAAITLRPV